MIRISIVIVEYNSVNDVLKCTSSIKIVSGNYDLEVIVSSNSLYEEEKCKMLLSTYPDLNWIFNDRNGGFAYAMNKGMKISKGDLIIIINPDTQFLSGLEDMVEFILSHREVGAIAPKLVNSAGELQDSYRNYLTPYTFFKRHFKRLVFGQKVLLENNIDRSAIQTVDWVIGAFIMVKREVYEITHGLDERYFLYCEDMDWCTRIKQCGYEIIYYPLAQVIYEGTRSARKSIKYSIIFINSLFRYWRKFGFYKI